MGADLRLVIFDVDGTLVDSQVHIQAAMGHAFAALGLAAPPLARTLAIVGLSLPEAIARLAPDQPGPVQAQIVRHYKDSFGTRRAAAPAPLYPGAAGALASLSARDDLLLGVATGKSMRGLRHMLSAHRLEGMFQTLQTADGHPSKPHPAMVLAALAETGVGAGQAVMVGDTTYDMEMARAAGVMAIGVGWGYHPVDALHAAGAARVVADYAGLHAAIEDLWRQG